MAMSPVSSEWWHDEALTLIRDENRRIEREKRTPMDTSKDQPAYWEDSVSTRYQVLEPSATVSQWTLG